MSANSGYTYKVDNSALQLQPGQAIRPMMDCQKAVELVKSLYGFTVIDVRELDSYDDRNFHVHVATDSHSNPHVVDVSRHGYVLKVLNTIDSQRPHVGGEHEMMRILRDNNIGCPAPILNLRGNDKSLEKLDGNRNEDAVYLVRLLTYIPGERIETVPYTSQLLYQLGQTLARVHNALQDIHHSALATCPRIWSLASTPRLRHFAYAVDDAVNRQLVLDVIDMFDREVVPNIPKFSTGVIHGDFNDENVLVRKEDDSSAEIIGIIDFGDSEEAPYIFDVAICTMCFMLESRFVDPLDVCGHILAGYLSRRQRALTELDRAVLWPCVAARFALSLTMGAYTYSVDQSNVHVLATAKHGWTLLRRMWRDTSREQLEARLDSVLTSYNLLTTV